AGTIRLRGGGFAGHSPAIAGSTAHRRQTGRRPAPRHGQPGRDPRAGVDRAFSGPPAGAGYAILSPSLGPDSRPAPFAVYARYLGTVVTNDVVQERVGPAINQPAGEDATGLLSVGPVVEPQLNVGHDFPEQGAQLVVVRAIDGFIQVTDKGHRR